MFWIILLVAFFASILTFFSGFGLGTLLLAAMLCYYPPELAIALTAIVHLLNSLFKCVFNRKVNWKIVLSFGFWAAIAAVLGSLTLHSLSELSLELYDLSEGSTSAPVTIIHFVMGSMLILFSVLEIKLKGRGVRAPLWLGGGVSGFMGGLSGHQGALRSFFLVREIKDVHQFIATSSFIGLLTDIARNAVYFKTISWELVSLNELIFTCMAAILGVLVGTYLLKKTSLKWLQQFVAVGIFLLGCAMLAGLV